MNGLSEGYKQAVDQNWGGMAKIGFLSQKPRFWAEKKRSLLSPNHVLATTGKSCSKKKVAFSRNKYQYQKLWVFFWVTMHFQPKKHFSAERKFGRFSVILARTRSVVLLGHFFYDPDGSPQFR